MAQPHYHRHQHHHDDSLVPRDPDCPPPVLHQLSRRRFLADVGRGTFAVTIFGATVIACSNDDAERGRPSDRGGTEASSSSTSEVVAQSVSWHRVNLGFVSAYVLVRGREAAIVDSGIAGSEAAIAQTLTDLGVGWPDVDHVMLTHFHPDHAGSVPAVLEAAEAATAYAGEADIPAIQSPRPLQPVGDGDEVFGLQIVATPGHTPGHISVLDPDGGFLIAGDALTAEAGELAGPNPQFTADLELAHDSVRRLADLRFADVLVGHGDPIEGDGNTQVAALAATL